MDKQLLIMGGGLGLLPKGDAFYEALNGVPGLSVTVIAGKNKKMYKKLHGKYENIRVLGFTDQVETYMRQADLIISKPGGLTLFEAIHLELPMLVFSPFLEQEIKNAEFIAENGIGRVLSAEPEESVEEILALLWDDAALSHMERNMRRMKDTLNEEALLEILSAYEKLASRAA